MIYESWAEKLTELEIPASEIFKLEELLTSDVEIS